MGLPRSGLAWIFPALHFTSPQPGVAHRQYSLVSNLGTFNPLKRLLFAGTLPNYKLSYKQLSRMLQRIKIYSQCEGDNMEGGK